MSDSRYSLIRGLLSENNHPEMAASRAGSVIPLYEADVGAHTVTPADGKLGGEPAHMGIQMPGAAKPPVDTRPNYAYDTGSGALVGIVQALIVPVQKENEIVGALPQRELVFKATRIRPDGAQQRFDNESNAKKFVGQDRKVKWYQAEYPDEWESVAPKTGKMHQTTLKEAKNRGLPSRWVTIDEMRQMCPACAEDMAKKGLSRVKVFVETKDPAQKWVDGEIEKGGDLTKRKAEFPDEPDKLGKVEVPNAGGPKPARVEEQEGWGKGSSTKWMKGVEKGKSKSGKSGFAQAVSRLKDEPGMNKGRAQKIVGHHYNVKKGKRKPAG